MHEHRKSVVLLVVILLPFAWKDLKFLNNNNLISFCLDLLSPIHFSMSAFLGIMNTHQKILRSEISFRWHSLALVGSSRFELPTSRLSGARSNHLSYEPIALPVFWWRWRDSNPWPPACRAGALPAELHPHIYGVSSPNGHPKLNNNWWLAFVVILFLWNYAVTLSANCIVSLERRWSSRTFRYGYLVTT